MTAPASRPAPAWWEEACRLRAQGMMPTAIAHALRKSISAVRYATNEDARVKAYAATRDWQDRNPEVVRQNGADWAARNRDRVNASARAAYRRRKAARVSA